jgi:hypothetical protein
MPKITFIAFTRGARAATEEDMLNLVAEPRGNLQSLSDLPVRIPL